jgi:hypothetical protein
MKITYVHSHSVDKHIKIFFVSRNNIEGYFIMLKKLIFLFIFSGCLMNIAACSEFVSWKEEVKLNDGRVIVVEQKKRMEGQIAREAWLTINLPEFSSQPIIWHENLNPLILNISNGKLYVVGRPPSGLEIRQYGIQKPFYIGFEWSNGAFQRIPFEEIPENIYTTNMLIDSFPSKRIDLMTLEQKNSIEVNNRRTIPDIYKRIDPKAGSLY